MPSASPAPVAFVCPAARRTCYAAAMRVEDIEEAILQLAPDDLAEFRRWFAAFESGMTPPKIPESAAVKFGRIAGRTLAEFRKLTREP